MLSVGLTGGIASGKSTVASQFAAFGVPIIDADVISRELMAPGSPLLQQIFERFDPIVQQRYAQPLRQADGALDRALLRRLVFEDASERRLLEALTHPAIRARVQTLSLQARGPYQIQIIPLLVEYRSSAHVDRVLVVDCPEALQLRRLQARDGSSEAQARALLAAQTTRQARLAAADDVITNDGDMAALGPQVLALHRKYLAMSGA